MNGEQFLDKLYKDLHMSEIVMHSAGEEKSKLKKIKKYMERLENTHKKATDDHKKELLKELYYKKYVIQEKNIPSSMDSEKIIKDQKKTLSKWLDYLLDDNARYPMWAKYWAFQGMLKIGTYNEVSDSYMKRSDKTLAPFIEVNPEVLAKCISLIQKYVDKEPLDEELEKLIESGSFNKIYTKLIKTSSQQRKEISNEGIWIKYNYESEDDAELSDYPEYEKLYDSLQGYSTGWCTAGSIDMAKDQICGTDNYAGGDFYVYYTKNDVGEYKVPRIAIRLKNSYIYEEELPEFSVENYGYNNQSYGSIIGEIRGIDDSQNLEEGLEETLEQQLRKIPHLTEKELSLCLKKVQNSKNLTKINRKNSKGIPLNSDEIIFLYEIKEKIDVFGWHDDPRIYKIKSRRNFKKDITSLSDAVKYVLISMNYSNNLWLDSAEIEKIKRWGANRDNILTIFKECQDLLTFSQKLEFAKKNGLILQYYKFNNNQKFNPSEIIEDKYEIDTYLNYGVSEFDYLFIKTCVEENLNAIEYIKNTPLADSFKNEVESSRKKINLFELSERELIDFIDGIPPSELEDKAFYGEIDKIGDYTDYIYGGVPEENYAKEKFKNKYKKEIEDINKITKDKDSILDSLKKDINILKYIDRSYFEDEDFMLELLKVNASAIKFFPLKAIENKDFILKAIKVNYKVSAYINFLFDEDKKLLKQCIAVNVNVIRGVAPDLQDEDIALTAIKKTAFSYLYLNDELKRNEKIIKIVCEKVKNNEKYIKNKDMMRKLFLEVISKNEKYINLFDLSVINQLNISTKAIIDANPRIILAVPTFRNNKKILLYALKKDISLLSESKLINMKNLELLLEGTEYIENVEEVRSSMARR